MTTIQCEYGSNPDQSNVATSEEIDEISDTSCYISKNMETSILNQYEEDLPNLLQPQESLFAGDTFMSFINDDDGAGTIDIIKYVLQDNEQENIQVLHVLDGNDTVHPEHMDSHQHIQTMGNINEHMTETSPHLYNRECSSFTFPIEHLLQTDYVETYYQTLVDVAPVIEPIEEQHIAVKEENLPKTINDTNTNEVENKKDTKEKVDNSTIFQKIHKSAKRTIKRAANAKKTKKSTQRKRKMNKGNDTIIKIEQDEQDDCIDIETVSDEIPVLEAGDVTSLLEQFEATENIMLPVKRCVKKKCTTRSKSSRLQDTSLKQPKHQNAIEKPMSCDNNIQENKRNLEPIVSLERLDRTTLTQNDKTSVPAISIMPKTEQQDNCDTDQIHNDKSTSSSNESLTIVKSTMTDPKKSNKNDTQSKTKNNCIRGLVDHDYCSSNNSIINKTNNNELTKPISELPRNQNTNFVKIDKTIEHCRNSNLKKTSGLVLNKVSDTCGISSTFILSNKQTMKANSSVKNNQNSDCLKEAPLRQIHANNLPIIKNAPNQSTNNTSMHEIKIESVLARKILKSREELLNKTQTQLRPTQHMVSVLKKPLNVSLSPICPILTNNLEESVVTTTSSSNEIIENIIVHNISDVRLQEQIKQPIRKRLKLEEYRNRKRFRSDNNIMNTPKYHVELIPIYNVFTSTESFINDLGETIFCQQELLSRTRYKLDTEEENKSKPITKNIETQTYKMDYNPLLESLVPNENKDTLKRNDESNSSRSRSKSRDRSKRTRSRSSRNGRMRSGSSRSRRTTSRSSRSRSSRSSRSRSSRSRSSRSGSSRSRRTRSRSKDRSRSMDSNTKSRSRNRSRKRRESNRRKQSKSRSTSRSKSRSITRNSKENKSKSRSSNDSRSNNKRSRSNNRRGRESRSRSLSRRCSNRYSQERWRRRRSSTSPSPNNSYTHSPRSKYRSRSRSYRSRSGSSSRSYSRPSSRSNFKRNNWSNHCNNRERSYNRYGRQLSYNHRDREWRSRSPLDYYHTRENFYNEEKLRQVEERRVIYVGGIDSETTKTDLYTRFNIFGPIMDISIHFRENSDNYGFVTFQHRNDAYQAVEHGNDNLDLPRYDLSFGGRRAFCQSKYEDLDGIADNSLEFSRKNEKNSFDYLLNKALVQRKLPPHKLV